MTPTEGASYWFVRQDQQPLSADDARVFEAWLAASAAHRTAYERTAFMWKNFGHARDDAQMRALRTAALASSPAPRVSPRTAAAAAAAVVIAIVGLGVFGKHLLTLSPESAGRGEAQNPAAGQYVTARNERSMITLSDGTLVSLNLDTALEVAFTPDQRRVRIARGQAFFEVAQDAARPFTIEAADRRISALGTEFDVRLDPDRVVVVLLEGRVAVDRASSLVDSIVPRRARIELEPGQRLVAARGEPVSITNTDAQRATRWRQGWVEFEDESLGAVVAELNRYSDRPIVVTDDTVRNLRLSGVFRIGQPDRFGAVIQELLPVRVVREGDATVLAPLDASAIAQP